MIGFFGRGGGGFAGSSVPSPKMLLGPRGGGGGILEEEGLDGFPSLLAPPLGARAGDEGPPALPKSFIARAALAAARAFCSDIVEPPLAPPVAALPTDTEGLKIDKKCIFYFKINQIESQRHQLHRRHPTSTTSVIDPPLQYSLVLELLQ